MKVLVDFDLSRNEIQNAVAQNLATAPSSPLAGQFYFDTASGEFRFYDGSVWKSASEVTLADLGITAAATELNYMDGVTSNVQTQLNAKAASSHNHAASNITSGILGVARGGTGAGTLTGLVYGNGTSAMSAATAAQIVAQIGATAVQRATGDASGNNIANTYAKLASPTFTGAPKAPTPASYDDSTRIATTEWVNMAIGGIIGATVFKGTVNTGTDISGLADYDSGWCWIVGTAGTYVGKVCEVGDWIYCISDRGTAYAAADFAVVQGNIVNAVTSEETLTVNKLVVGKGGRQLMSSDITSWEVVHSDAVLTDGNILVGEGGRLVSSGPSADMLVRADSASALSNGGILIGGITGDAPTAEASGIDIGEIYPRSVGILGNGSTSSFTATHEADNLHHIAQLYDNDTKEQVLADIVIGTNADTVTFATPPASGKRYVLVVH